MNKKEKTVKEAIAENYGNLVFEFEEKKFWKIEGEELETDQYGHEEVSLDSFLISFAGVEENDSIDEAYEKVRKYLLAHEVDSEE